MYYLFKWDDTQNVILVKRINYKQGEVVVSKINRGGSYWGVGHIYPLNIEPPEILVYKNKDLKKVMEIYLMEIL